MNDHFEHNLSATLRELSKEAVPVNLSEHALRGARRRVVLVAASAVAATAVMIGAVPLAMAATGPDRGPVAPANVNTKPHPNSNSPVPSTADPNSPVPSTANPNSPVPRTPGANSPVPSTANPNSPVPPASELKHPKPRRSPLK